MIKRLCIIPARGGSKRLPDKNIRPFMGLPMIGHSLRAARGSGLFSAIHVSTDSDRIREVVEGLGFPVQFPRPASLADDFTPLMPVLKYVVNRFAEQGESFDQVCLLMACAPLVEASDLRGAAELFDAFGGMRPVMSISPYPAPVEWAYECDAAGVLTPREPGMFAVRSQDLKKRYYETGCYLFFPVATILDSEGAGSDAHYVGHHLPKWKAVDIDDAEDWALAESLARGQQAAVNRLQLFKQARLTLWLEEWRAWLRPLTVADITPAYVDGLNHPRVAQFLVAASAARQTVESVSAYVQSNHEAVDGVLFGFFLDGQLCGTVRLHDVGAQEAYVGIAIFAHQVWGQGWGMRMIGAVSRFAFEQLGLVRLKAGVKEGNLGSERAFEKAGFHQTEGRIWRRSVDNS